MKSKLVVLIWLNLMAITSYSQIDTYLNAENFKWSSWDKIEDMKEKVTFLDSAGIGESASLLNIYQYYYIVDIDGDEEDDIIFDGYKLNGRTILYLFDAQDSTFSEVFNKNEELVSIARRKPLNPINFQTRDHSSASGSDFYLHTYIPGYVEGKLTFHEDNTLVINRGLELINENMPPVKFEIKSVPDLKADADASSRLLNSYEVGYHGYAVASKQGENLRTWWLVLIPEGKGTFRVGWMQSNHLKRIFR